jgi:hypothetical protein
MGTEFDNVSEVSEPKQKSFVPWIIGIVIIILLCCCCAFIISGWFLGDIVIQIFEDLFVGIY